MSDFDAQSKDSTLQSPVMRSPSKGGQLLNRSNSEGIFILSSEKDANGTFNAMRVDGSEMVMVPSLPVNQFQLAAQTTPNSNRDERNANSNHHHTCHDGNLQCRQCLIEAGFEKQMMPLCTMSSAGESDSIPDGTNSHYYQQSIGDLKEQLRHLQFENQMLLPDLEKKEAEIYDLKEQVTQQEKHLTDAHRANYNLQRLLDDAKAKILIQEKVIEDAGAQRSLDEALLKQKHTEATSTLEGMEQEATREMFQSIQQRLSELSAVEKCQREIEVMKTTQMKSIEKFNEAKRSEKAALDQNKQLVERINQLENDLDHYKTLSKDLKREKLAYEQEFMKMSAKEEQLGELMQRIILQQQAGSSPRQQTPMGNVSGQPDTMTVSQNDLEMLRGNELRPRQEIIQFVETYRPGEANEIVEFDDDKAGNGENAWNDDFFREQAVNGDELVEGEMFGDSNGYAKDEDDAGQFTPELPQMEADEEAVGCYGDVGPYENHNNHEIEVKRAEEQLSIDGPSFVSPNASFETGNILAKVEVPANLPPQAPRAPVSKEHAEESKSKIVEPQQNQQQQQVQVLESQECVIQMMKRISQLEQKVAEKANEPLEFGVRKNSMMSTGPAYQPLEVRVDTHSPPVTQRSLGPQLGGSHKNTGKFALHPKPTGQVDFTSELGGKLASTSNIRMAGLGTTQQLFTNKRSSEHRARPPYINSDEAQRRNQGLATGRSKLLSNGSKPTSYGTSSQYSMNRIFTRGLIGPQEQLFTSARGNSGGLINGVRSDAGNSNDISSIKSPSVKSQLNMTGTSSSKKMKLGGSGSTFGGTLNINSFSLKAKSSRSPTNIVKTTTITIEPQATKRSKASKKWNPQGSMLEEITVNAKVGNQKSAVKEQQETSGVKKDYSSPVMAKIGNFISSTIPIRAKELFKSPETRTSTATAKIEEKSDFTTESAKKAYAGAASSRSPAKAVHIPKTTFMSQTGGPMSLFPMSTLGATTSFWKTGTMQSSGTSHYNQSARGGGQKQLSALAQASDRLRSPPTYQPSDSQK